MSWDLDIKNTIEKAGGYVGEDVFIGKYCIFTAPSLIRLQNRVRIDPFCLITVNLTVSSNCQICSHSVIGGGSKHKVNLGEFCFIGYGSKLFCGSEDYSGEYGPVNDFWGKNKVFSGDITFKDFSGIASDVIIMPGVTLPEGCTIGAKSFVYKNPSDPWTIYLGNPLREHKVRNRDQILALSKDPSYIKSH